MKLGAAPETDRHTLQLSEPCPAMATSLRVTNSHMDISRRPGSPNCSADALYTHTVHRKSKSKAAFYPPPPPPTHPHPAQPTPRRLLQQGSTLAQRRRLANWESLRSGPRGLQPRQRTRLWITCMRAVSLSDF